MAVAYSLDQKGRSMQRLYRKRIVLGVGGGIAATRALSWSADCATRALKCVWS